MKTVNKKHILAGLLLAAAVAPANAQSVTHNTIDIYNKLVAVIKKEVIGKPLIYCGSPFCEYPAKFFYYLGNKMWVAYSNGRVRDFAKKNGCSKCKDFCCPTKKLLQDHSKYSTGFFSFGAHQFKKYYALKDILDKNIKNSTYLNPVNTKE